MVVIAIAVFAAALNALGAAGEQRAASRLAAVRAESSPRSGHADHGRGSGRTLRRPILYTGRRHLRGAIPSGYWFAVVLVTTPMWLAGWSADVLGFLGQAAALHLGSLSLVQPLMVTTLLFSLPLAAFGSGRWPGLRDWSGAVAVSAGLGLLVSTRQVPATQTVREVPLIAGMLIVVVGAAGVIVLIRTRVLAQRAALLSVAAGALFSVGAAATKLAADAYSVGGFFGLLTSWSAYVLAMASVGGLALQQAGFASGSLPVAMTALIITDPLISYGLGVVGFGEPPPTGGAALSLAAVGAIVLMSGVVLLAHSPLLHPESVPASRPACTPRQRVAPRLADAALRRPRPSAPDPAPIAATVADSGEQARDALTGSAAPRELVNRACTRCCPTAGHPLGAAMRLAATRGGLASEGTDSSPDGSASVRAPS